MSQASQQLGGLIRISSFFPANHCLSLVSQKIFYFSRERLSAQTLCTTITDQLDAARYTSKMSDKSMLDKKPNTEFEDKIRPSSCKSISSPATKTSPEQQRGQSPALHGARRFNKKQKSEQFNAKQLKPIDETFTKEMKKSFVSAHSVQSNAVKGRGHSSNSVHSSSSKNHFWSEEKFDQFNSTRCKPMDGSYVKGMRNAHLPTDYVKSNTASDKRWSSHSYKFSRATNDSEDKTTQKRHRATSGSEPHHPKSSLSAGSYRNHYKWRKLQHGTLEVRDKTRSWQQLKQVPAGSPGMELSLMSYNILAQDLLDAHSDLYSQCRSSDLQWFRRGAAILQQIISHNPDIVCLQEVQADHWKHDIRPVLNSRGYFGVFQQRKGDKSDGCAILFKMAKFSLIKTVPVNFRQGGILDRDNVGLILLLKPYSKVFSGVTKKICVATTHLLFNPRRGDVKLAQLIMFLAEIDKVAAIDPEEKRDQESNFSKHKADHRKRDIQDVNGNDSDMLLRQSELHMQGSHFAEQAQSNNAAMATTSVPTMVTKDPTSFETRDAAQPQRYCPIILCGDFNSEPFCDLYRFITTGQLKYEGLINRFICGQAEGKERGANIYLDSNLLPQRLGITESCQYIKILRDRYSRQKKRLWQNLSSREKRSHQGECDSKKVLSKEESGIESKETEIKGEHLASSQINPSPQHFPVASGYKIHCSNDSHQESIQSDIAHQSMDSNKCEEGSDREISFSPPKMNSGNAYHHMNFKSVYSHVTEIPGLEGKMMWEVSSHHERCSCTLDYIFYSSFPAPPGKPSYPSKSSDHCNSFVSLKHTEMSDQGFQNDTGHKDENKRKGHGKDKDAYSHPSDVRQNSNDPDQFSNYEAGHNFEANHSPDKAQQNLTVSPCPEEEIYEEGEIIEEEKQLELLARYSLLTSEETARAGYLPNATLPSDHLCLIAKFFLR
ncbi:protein angel homolog 2 [Plakobranchus ocellatus]|uniref:Protein angel homolog 2 n=1 Tax=Plakobranchus ocellatus TaxID=259542 RepID=A0AAV3YNE9_9GAST|nr:protein angel homolog 2 [Plakobranchus ocellatus]